MARILVRSAQMDQGDPFWHHGAEQLLEVVLHATLTHTEPSLSQAMEYLQGILSLEKQKQLCQKLSVQAQNQFTALLSANPRIVSSFHAVALNSLRMLNVPEISYLLSEADIDFLKLRQEKCAVFLLMPIEKIAYYGFILNLFYTQFFNAMMKSLPKPGEKKVFALLDEFAHAQIEDMDIIAAVIRKYDVSLTLVIQSLAQLQSRYGLRAKTLIQNCQTRVILEHANAELKNALNLSHPSPGRQFGQLNAHEIIAFK